ncbi:PKD domain-containing protein [Rubellicoccus peritrichatus]|uniref:PKD domain-containing protein n=1 Tax=Rubellicoccus peritrichatus TaxID=3080537 RepID=A0AAQ3LG26_9BACT|nr:PKD domain-containing protein [Puniceicoccus sp. CR14]WOO41479.1 PKD domain-containing protein [Puniceicoccus sp. CR14]
MVSSQKVVEASIEEHHSCTHGCEHHPDLSQQQSAELIPSSSIHPEVAKSFTEWLASDKLVVDNQVLDMLQHRYQRMKLLIQQDPEQALEESITWTDYERLPQELVPFVEKPFSKVASLTVLPTCNFDHGHGTTSYNLEFDGDYYVASVYGRRLAHTSKANISLQGITLDEFSAVRENPMQPLSTEDADTLSHLPIINPDPTIDLRTGEPLGEAPVTALMGNRRVLFAAEESLLMLNEELALLDEPIGPDSRADILFETAYFTEGFLGATSVADALEGSELVSMDTTHGVKKVLYLRVDFADRSGAKISQSELEGILQRTSDVFEDMSFGKTSLDYEVPGSVVRLPHDATYYQAISSSIAHRYIYSHALSVYRVANPGFNEYDYDIIGIHMPALWLSWTGRAEVGGRGQWVQHRDDPDIFIHEFGHNYGLRHANLWDVDLTRVTDPTVTNGNVANGIGDRLEYGDITDFMGIADYDEAFFHPQARNRLQWFEAGVHWDFLNQDDAVDDSGVYRIYQLDDAGTTESLLRGIRIKRNRTGSQYLWVGYRANYNDYFRNGAYINWQQTSLADRAILIDMTPESEHYRDDSKDAPLLIGQTYYDFVGDFYITTIAKGGTHPDEWLDVQIEFGSDPANNAPTASGMTIPEYMEPNKTYTFTVNDVLDLDSDELVYHWNTDDGAIHESTSSLDHNWGASGAYELSVTISDKKGGVVVLSETISIVDGLTNWSAHEVDETYKNDYIENLNGRFVMTSTSSNNRISTSLDGYNWIHFRTTNSENNDGIYVDGLYIITGGDGGSNSYINTSSDGYNWTSQTTGETESLNDIAYGDGLFVAVGNGGLIQYSSDASSWTTASAPTSEDITQIGFGGGVFIAISDSGVWRSTDGASWTNQFSEFDPSTGYGKPVHVLYHHGVFVMGFSSVGIYYSTDLGLTWTQVDGLPYAHNNHTDSLASNGDLLVAFHRETNDTFVYLISEDGINWTESPVTPFAFSPGFESWDPVGDMTFGGGRFIKTFYETTRATSLVESDSFFPSNLAPSVSIDDGPTKADVGADLTFTATLEDLNGDDLITIWNVDNGDSNVLSEGESLTYTFPAAGVYDITLTVSDEKGGVTVDTHRVSISEPTGDPFVPETATVEVRPATGIYGTRARLNGMLVNDGGSSTSATIYYGLVDGGENPSKWYHSTSFGEVTEGAFSMVVSDFIEGMTYYYRIHASNLTGESWSSNAQSFRVSLDPDVLYLDILDDLAGTELLGSMPDITPASEVWENHNSSNNGFYADGSFTADVGHNSIFLPFAPTAGNIYTLSAILDVEYHDDARFGFLLSFAEENGNYYPKANKVYGYVEILGESFNREAFTSTGIYSSGEQSVDTSEVPDFGDVPVSIVLDATDADAANWTMEFFIDGESVRGPETVASGSYGDIAYVGLGKTSDVGGGIKDFTLTVDDQLPDTTPPVDKATAALSNFPDAGGNLLKAYFFGLSPDLARNPKVDLQFGEDSVTLKYDRYKNHNGVLAVYERSANLVDWHIYNVFDAESLQNLSDDMESVEMDVPTDSGTYQFFRIRLAPYDGS